MKATPRVFVAIAVLAVCAGAQTSQTLPAGFLATVSGSGSAWPFNLATPSRWQWHYDSGQFTGTGPLTISEIWVRSVSTAGTVAAFNFPSVTVTLASSPTDYSVAGSGGLPGHDPIFANNLNPDATVVMSGPFAGGPVPGGTWIPLGLTGTFVYDPGLGNDFVLEIRVCSSNTPWGQSIDGVSGGAGVVGGNRYGANGDCNAVQSTLQNNEYVPVVRIDYFQQNILAISQSGPGVGDLNLSLTSLSPTATSGWMLLSADVGGAAGSGPFLGLVPDASTWLLFFTTPMGVGNPFHFPTVAPAGFFPGAPFVLGPGAVSSLTGMTVDVVFLMVAPGPFYDSKSNLIRFTFN